MMKRFSKLLVITMVLLFWNAGQIGSVENRKLKGKHVFSMYQTGISLQERIRLVEGKFSREFKSDYFLSGYTFEARSNSSIGGTTIDCQGESISRIIRRGDRLIVRTFGHVFEGKDKDCPEISDRDLVFLHKKKGSGFEIVDVALLDRAQAVEIKEIPFFWLGMLHTAESLKFIKKLFDNPSDRVKKNVLAAIAMHRHPDVAGFLYGIARGNTRALELRKNAIFWLGTVQDSTSFSFLKKIAAEESENALRKQLVFAFYLNGSPEAVRELVKIARTDASTSHRKNAIFWLGQKASKECIRVLDDVVEMDEDLEVKSSAVFAISQLHHSKAVPMLIRIARENRHSQIRKKAMFWLGEIGDQNALKFFEEILLK